MNAETINDFIMRIENHDVQSFENEILQFWTMLNKTSRSVEIFKNFETRFSDLSQEVSEFYRRIDESFNKKKYIDTIRTQIQSSEEARTALGYFLLKEEVAQKTIGYYRLIFYWFGDCEPGNYNAAKKGFIKNIIKPLTDAVESE
jgi:hypothetical protein